MQVCHACGNACADTAKFCPECGTHLLLPIDEMAPPAHIERPVHEMQPTHLVDADRFSADEPIYPDPAQQAESSAKRAIRVVNIPATPSPTLANAQQSVLSHYEAMQPELSVQIPPKPFARRKFTWLRSPLLIGTVLGLIVAAAAATWLTQVISRTTPHLAPTGIPTYAVTPGDPRHPAPAPTGLPAYAAPSAKVIARAQATSTTPTQKQAPKPATHPTQSPKAESATASDSSHPPREHGRQSASAAAPTSPAKGDWYASLKEDLNNCTTEQSGFFARMVCRTRAQNRHCDGHWNAVPECPHVSDKNTD